VPATRSEFWMAKISTNKNRDVASEEKLRALGWRVAIVWECALRSNQRRALRYVADFVTSNSVSIQISG
jgi:DNA mismatch endonuclease (patch repair protein)